MPWKFIAILLIGSWANAHEPIVVPSLDSPTYGFAFSDVSEVQKELRVNSAHKKARGAVVSKIYSDGALAIQGSLIDRGDLIVGVDGVQGELKKAVLDMGFGEGERSIELVGNDWSTKNEMPEEAIRSMKYTYLGFLAAGGSVEDVDLKK